jgi:ABC-type antimicrobial peptide transport system permease subunit
MVRGLSLVAVGSVIGVFAAFVLTRLLASLLYGVGALDARAVGGAVVVLLLISSLAALIPARRASRTDPALVLRQQ